MVDVDLSIIIISFNTRALTSACVSSVVAHTKNLEYEIVVIDNNSTDGSVIELKKMAAKNKKIKLLINKKNVGFAAANNQGVKISKGKYILFLNSDTEIRSSLLKEMYDWMESYKDVGASSCSLLNKDGSIQGTGGYFPNLLRVFSWMTIQDLPGVDSLIKPFHPMKSKAFSPGEKFYQSPREVDWITGAFLLVRRQAAMDAKEWDEKYFMYTEDVDYCFKVKKHGWKIFFLPKWSIVHLGGASSTKEFSVLSEYKGIKRFYKKHYPTWHYPILRIFLKIGALGRIPLFAILEGSESAKIYAKAFLQA